MEGPVDKKELEGLRIYMPRALKFYELKVESMTPILFSIMLFISFGGAMLPTLNGPASISMLPLLIEVTLIPVASCSYLVAYIRELRGMEYTFQACLKSVLSKFPGIFVLYAAYFSGVYTSIMLLSVLPLLLLALIPLVVFGSIYLILIVCYILDTGEGLKRAVQRTIRITRGVKGRAFNIVMTFNLILAIPFYFFVAYAITSNNRYIVGFVISFVSTLINLMQQRLIAMIYLNLEYGVHLGGRKDTEF